MKIFYYENLEPYGIQKPGAVNIIPCIIIFIVYNDTLLQCYMQTYLI